jgi:hypothetical protein
LTYDLLIGLTYEFCNFIIWKVHKIKIL